MYPIFGSRNEILSLLLYVNLTSGLENSEIVSSYIDYCPFV